MNKKGFSLVELIVVIAIMAVLVGILAPTLIGYVEKSRKQKDESAVAELVSQLEIALNEDAIYNEVVEKVSAETGKKLTIKFSIANNELTVTNGSTTVGDATLAKLAASLAETVGKTINISSKAYKGMASYNIVIDGSGTAMTVAPTGGTNGWIEKTASTT